MAFNKRSKHPAANDDSNKGKRPDFVIRSRQVHVVVCCMYVLCGPIASNCLLASKDSRHRKADMQEHPALTSDVALAWSVVAHTEDGSAVITSVGEALRFLVDLPERYDGVHWELASISLCFAHQCPDSSRIATRAFLHALETDDLLGTVMRPAADTGSSTSPGHQSAGRSH